MYSNLAEAMCWGFYRTVDSSALNVCHSQVPDLLACCNPLLNLLLIFNPAFIVKWESAKPDEYAINRTTPFASELKHMKSFTVNTKIIVSVPRVIFTLALQLLGPT